MFDPIRPDLFVVHAEIDDDSAFVHTCLVPALGLAADRVLLSSALPLGMSVLQAVEQGLVASRVTVIVISSALLSQNWWSFCAEMASCHAIRGGQIVPLLLTDCAVPLWFDLRVKLDCRVPGRRGAEIARLREWLELLDADDGVGQAQSRGRSCAHPMNRTALPMSSSADVRADLDESDTRLAIDRRFSEALA